MMPLHNGFLDMKKISFWWDNDDSMFDWTRAMELYIKDKELWAEYINKHIWYLIQRSWFKTSTDEYDEIPYEVLPFVCRKLNEQIERYWTAFSDTFNPKMVWSYICKCLWWMLLYRQKKIDDFNWVIDIEEIQENLHTEIQLDTDHEYEYMKYKILYNSWLTEEEISVWLLYMEWYWKYSIYKNLPLWRPFVDTTIEKIRNITYKYLKWDVNYIWTIEREPQETKMQGDSAWVNDIPSSL